MIYRHLSNPILYGGRETSEVLVVVLVVVTEESVWSSCWSFLLLMFSVDSASPARTSASARADLRDEGSGDELISVSSALTRSGVDVAVTSEIWCGCSGGTDDSWKVTCLFFLLDFRGAVSYLPGAVLSCLCLCL